MARLHVGFGRCTLETSEGPGRHFWSGLATEQTRISRRRVFEASGMPFEISDHSGALNVFRRDAFKKILKILLMNTGKISFLAEILGCRNGEGHGYSNGGTHFGKRAIRSSRSLHYVSALRPF
jgi:hypothetical protein